MLFLSAFIGRVLACTYFTLPEIDGEYVVGRSMEFMEAFPSKWWLLRTHPVDEPKGFAKKYGYVGIDANIPASYSTTMGLPKFEGPISEAWANLLDMTSEGMNTAGLSASALVFSESQYQELTTWQAATDKRIQLPYMEMLPFILGRYATVNETLQALQYDVVVFNPYPNEIPPGFQFHYGLADAHGDHATVEYINGEISVTLNGIGVMTNDPEISWHARNLNNYAHLGPHSLSVDPRMTVDSHTAAGVVPKISGHGQGLLGLPGDYTPAGRFVRTFYLRQIGLANQPPSNLMQSIDMASALLDNVRIVHGTVTNKAPPAPKSPTLAGRLSSLAGYEDVSFLEFTPWNTIKLPKTRTFIFRTFENTQWKSIHLEDLHLEKGAEPKTIELFDGKPGVLDFTKALL